MSDFIHDQNEFDSYHSESVGQPGPVAEFSGVPGGSAGFVPPEPPRKKGRRGMKIVALLLACVIVGGGAGVGGAALYGNLSGGQGGTTIYEADTPLSAVTLSNVPSSDPMTPAEIYAANVNATVGITVDVVTTNWWGMTTSGAAAGSGFVITQDGYIVTNYHVIDVQGAQTITVAMYDGTTYPATVVGYDEDHDLAVLKIEATGLQTVVLGDSDSLVVGGQRGRHRQPPGRADLLPDHRRHQRAGPLRHPQQRRGHGPDADRLRHQLGQLRRPAVQPIRRGGGHYQRQVLQQQQL